MPLKATIVSEQQITVPTADSGGARALLIITTGLMEIKLVVNNSQATESYSALLKDPVPGQFRRAIATASIAGIEYGLQTELNNNDARWLVTNATAHLDDETSRVELVVDVQVTATKATAMLINVGFQVTTYAAGAMA